MYGIKFYDIIDGWIELEEYRFNDFNEATKKCEELMSKLNENNKKAGEYYEVVKITSQSESAEEYVKRVLKEKYENLIRDMMMFYKDSIDSATREIDEYLQQNAEYEQTIQGTANNMKLFSVVPDQVKEQFETGELGAMLKIIWEGNLKQSTHNFNTMSKFVEKNKKEIEELRERKKWYEAVYEELKKLNIPEIDQGYD